MAVSRLRRVNDYWCRGGGGCSDGGGSGGAVAWAVLCGPGRAVLNVPADSEKFRP